MKLSKSQKLIGALAVAMLLLAVAAAVISIAGNPAPSKPLFTGSTPLATSPFQPDDSLHQGGSVRYGEVRDGVEAYWMDHLSDPEAFNEKLRAQAPMLFGFWETSTRQFLSGSGGENTVYSPLNLYMSLATLAEISDGNTRQQVLDLLGGPSLEELREQSMGLWLALYARTDLVCRIANSLWLNNSIDFEQATLDTLAETHFADSFRGDPGTEEFDKLLRDWLDQNTGGLLKDQTADFSLDPELILALASTVYYHADWVYKFDSQDNFQGDFHAPDGDLECTFMRESCADFYYRGEHFGAVCKTLGYSDTMWFILPDEDQDIDGLLAEESDLWEFFAWSQKRKQSWWYQKYVTLNTSLPKFDIQSDLDLKEGLQSLGVTDLFDLSAADFSPLIKNSLPAAVTQIQHASRVIVDEEGCTAASFVLEGFGGASSLPTEVVEFTLDRPFLFVVEPVRADMPLYAGVVNKP